MADAKFTRYSDLGGGTVVIPDNNSTALDIESVAGEEFIIADTATPKLTLKAGGNATQDVEIDGNGNLSGSGGQYSLRATAATATTPNICPDNGDLDTGIGSSGNDQLSLVTGGVEGIRIAKDDSLDVVYVGINGAADDVNNTLLQLNGDSDEAELAFKLSGGETTTMGYRGQAVFSIDANGGFQIRNQGGSKRAEVDTSGNFTTFHTTTVQDDNLQVQANSADAVSKSLIFKKSRDTTDGSAGTIVQDNDVLGEIEFKGANGAGAADANFSSGAKIFARVNGTPGDDDMPTEIVFATSASGTETPTDRIFIRQNGNLGINDSAPNYLLTNVGGKSVPLFLSSNSNTTAIGTSYTSFPNGGAAAMFDHRVGDSIYLMNTTAENTADGRETGIGFFGRVDLSSDEYHYQGAIRCRHEGSAADQKGYLQFLTNDGDDNRNIQERMRIDSSGNVGINQTNPTKQLDVVGDVKFSATALANVIGLASDSQYKISFGATDSASKLKGPLGFQVTSEPTGIADCAEIYAKDISTSAEMFVRDEAGNETQISPHNFEMFDPDPSQTQPWSYTSKNSYIGKEIGVDMFGLVKAVEELSGKKLMYERDLPDEEVKDWYVEQGRIQAARENAIAEWDASKAANDGGISSDQPRPEPYTVKDPPDWLKSRLKLDNSH